MPHAGEICPLRKLLPPRRVRWRSGDQCAQYWINIDNVILAAAEWRGNWRLHDAGHSADTLSGAKSKFREQLRGQALTVSQRRISRAGQPASRFVLPLVPDGLRLTVMRQRRCVCRRNRRWWMRNWKRDNAGQLIVMARGNLIRSRSHRR